MNRVERLLAHGPRRGAGRRRDPPLSVHDARDRILLGHVIEHVPLVVRAVLGRVGDLREREESELELSGIEADRIRSARHRTAIVTREVAQSRPSSSRISTSQIQLVRPRWKADALAVHRTRGHRTQEVRVVGHAERRAARRPHRDGRAHRRQRLGDRGVHAAVHDAHRLAHGVGHGQPAREPTDLLAGRIDVEAEHADEALLDWDDGVRSTIHRSAFCVRFRVAHPAILRAHA